MPLVVAVSIVAQHGRIVVPRRLYT